MPVDEMTGERSSQCASQEKTGLLIEEQRGTQRQSWAHLRLPPFPRIALRVLQLARNQDVSLPQLCDLISTDPAFAGEVLTVANSVLYAPRYPSNSILQAITILGSQTLQGMCVTVGVRAYLGNAMSQPAMRSLWRHNLACALIAEQLASLGIAERNFAYTAGILHDVGRMGLAVLEPQGYAALLETYRGPAAGVLEPERQLFGRDHCEIGSQLAEDWKLPSEFTPILCEHHAPRRNDGAWSATELIKIACKMADAAGYAAFGGAVAVPYPELLEELPARERRLFFPSLDALSATISERINAVELA